MTENPEQAMSANAAALQESAHYYQWNLSLFPIEKNKRVLDMGCGPGHYFSEINKYEPSFYLGADYSLEFLEQAKKTFAGFPNYQVCQLDLLDGALPAPIGEQTFDYAFCFDVIEHIHDDVQVLRNIHKIMLTTGIKYLFLRVPALQSIYGENDKAIGHFRRYSAAGLSARLRETGFTIHQIHYQNFFGIFFWYFVGNIAKRKNAVSRNEGKMINWITPLFRSLEIVPPLIGLSLYCVCSANTHQ